MVETKHYYDFTNELSSDEIYEGLLAYGLFTEKLPPVFSAKEFFDYCVDQSPAFPKKPAEYIYHESIRTDKYPSSAGHPKSCIISAVMQIHIRDMVAASTIF